MPLTQRKISMNAYLFFLVSMNHSRILNNSVNGIHERGLSGDVHTQIFTLNVKMTFLLQLSHLPLKLSGVTKYLCCKASYIGTIGNTTTSKSQPTIP